MFAISVLVILGVCLYMCLCKTKQISVPVPQKKDRILSDDFKKQSIDDPVYHPEPVHKFDGKLGL